MIQVGVVMPFAESGWAIFNAALAAIVVAELVHYGMAVGIAGSIEALHIR